MESANLMGDAWQHNPEYNHVADYLGLDPYDRQDLDTANKISFIRDWAGGESKSEDLNPALVKVWELRKKLGTQRIGKDLVSELYQAIRIHGDTNQRKAEAVIASKQKRPLTQEQKMQTSIQKAVKQVLKGVGKALQGAL
jgi:hypothetical protein